MVGLLGSEEKLWMRKYYWPLGKLIEYFKGIIFQRDIVEMNALF